MVQESESRFRTIHSDSERIMLKTPTGPTMIYSKFSIRTMIKKNRVQVFHFMPIKFCTTQQSQKNVLRIKSIDPRNPTQRHSLETTFFG